MTMLYPLTADNDNRFGTAAVDSAALRRPLVKKSPRPRMSTRSKCGIESSARPVRQVRRSQNVKPAFGRFADLTASTTILPRTVSIRATVAVVRELIDPVDAVSAAVCSAIVGGLLAVLI